MNPSYLQKRSLYLYLCGRFSHGALNELKHMSALLTYINHESCSRATEASLTQLRQKSSITSLNLLCCRSITDEGLKAVKHYSALISLNR